MAATLFLRATVASADPERDCAASWSVCTRDAASADCDRAQRLDQACRALVHIEKQRDTPIANFVQCRSIHDGGVQQEQPNAASQTFDTSLRDRSLSGPSITPEQAYMIALNPIRDSERENVVWHLETACRFTKAWQAKSLCSDAFAAFQSAVVNALDVNSADGGAAKAFRSMIHSGAGPSSSCLQGDE